MNALSRNIEFVPKVRCASMDSGTNVLADIYAEEVNIAVWQRQLSQRLSRVVDQLLKTCPELQLLINAEPSTLPFHLKEFSDGLKVEIPRVELLIQDIANIANMFCCLFDLKRTGLRLTALNKAMCPRFHVDQVPARLVTTYQGSATEWLRHEHVDRRMLGVGSKGIADDVSGLYLLDEDVQQLTAGDVAILKGEAWEGNEQAGLVHRSPSLKIGERRLLLTLDFMA